MLGNGLREGKKTDKRIIITVNVQKKESKSSLFVFKAENHSNKTGFLKSY
jgi:hypothetical protein